MKKLLKRAHRHWRLRSATALAAVGALMASAGVVMLSAPTAGADPPDPAEDKKVVVCKYTQTPPGVPDHIIVVSISTIKNFPEVPRFPWTFADAQDSVAIRFAVGNEQPGDEELVNCPERRAAKTPAGITITDPCDPGNISWVAKADEFFTYSQTGSTVHATLKNPSLHYATGTTSWTVVDSGVLCPYTPTPTPPAPLEELAPAVTFTDATCDTLGEEAWDGTLEAFLDYEATGEAGPGETVVVEAMIEPAYADEYEFAEGAQTEFTHTFADITLEDCVEGEETVIPKPDKPEPKPDKKPTVKGVEVVAPPAAAPTAVAAGLTSDSGTATAQLLGQVLAGLGLAMLIGAGVLAPRRVRGVHES